MTVASREAWSKRGSADRDQGQHFKILTKTGGGCTSPQNPAADYELLGLEGAMVARNASELGKSQSS